MPKIPIDGIKGPGIIGRYERRIAENYSMDTDQDSQTAQERHIREEQDGESQYVLHPLDNDLFLRTGRQVIDGCRLGISIEVWFHECDSMFEDVAKWAADRSDRISACYAVPRGVGMCLFFVPVSESFDFDLADQLAELNSRLVRTFCVGPVEINQIPADEKARFIAPNTAREIYPHADRPPQAVAS